MNSESRSGAKAKSSARSSRGNKSKPASVKKNGAKDLKGLYGARLKAVRGELKKRKLAGLLVTDLKNIRYLTGFTGSSAFVVVTLRSGLLLTDSRYTSQATSEVMGLKVRIYERDPFGSLADLIKKDSFKGKTGKQSLGFESDHLKHSTYILLRRLLRPITLRATTGLLLRVRTKKDASELALLRESAKLLTKGFEMAKRILRPGVVESEAAWKIESFFRSSGAEALAFDTIIASGFRGALPHGIASKKKIKKGDLVVVDMGALLNGYNSDCTRTFMVGKPTKRQKEIYSVVLEGQSRAVEMVRPGVKVSEIDRAARSVIEEAGFGKYFTHSTGHGVGLDIHEAPGVTASSDAVLEEGMVITVEPGIYLPDVGGVRIEDMVVVGSSGPEVITGFTKELVLL